MNLTLGQGAQVLAHQTERVAVHFSTRTVAMDVEIRCGLVPNMDGA